jgi:AcrR family transcriptional regulator
VTGNLFAHGLDFINWVVNYEAMTRDTTPVTEERQRDADRSQSTILAAARDEFAEYGLGGARMDRIAERAGLNKRLIYYYFSDKEALFQAVLEQAYRDIREQERQLNLLDVEPPRRCAGWWSSPGTTTWPTPSS